MIRLPLLLALLAAPAAAQEVGDPAALFLAPAVSTASADVVIDAKGLPHMALVGWAPDAEEPPAFYATCARAAAECRTAADWTLVPLGARAREVQVAVTAKGAPRLLIASSSATQEGGLDYAYAECDGGCSDPTAWTVTTLRTAWDSSFSSFTADRLPQRTFALDPQGRPRFLYADRNYLVEPDHYGMFYMSCEADCAVAANWTETDLARHTAYDTEILDAPALAFAPDGAPRVVARLFGFDEQGGEAPQGLYYLACDAACTTPASWARVLVNEVGGGSYPSPTWDLEVDAQGRPRVALFAGAGMADPSLDHALIYFWCDAADCLAPEGAWNGQVVQTGQGESASLALDAAGHPRIAFRIEDGSLGVVACDEGCETFEGAWRGAYVEGQAEQAAARPTAIPFTCDGEVWEDLAPELALDGSGRAYVAADVSVEARCLYREVGEPEITYEFHPIWRGARLVAFDLP